MSEAIEQKTENEDQQTVSNPVNKDRSSMNRVSVVAIVLLVVVTMLLAWFTYQQRMQFAQLNQDLKQVSQTLGSSASNLTNLEARHRALSNQISSMEGQHERLVETVTQLQNAQVMSTGDIRQLWTLAEVESLLNIANQRVLLAKDAAGGLEALALADNLVLGLSDFRLHPLRDLIAQEKLALSASPQPDVEGVALQIQSAINEVDSLQVLMAAPVEQVQSDSAIETSLLELEGWKSMLNAAWSEVKSLVVIRHQQDGKAAVLVPEQRYFLYQNLKLKLETLQFALLTRNQAVFQQSASEAISWLDTYFTGDKRDALKQMIEQLQSTRIYVELPDISGSATWLKEFKQ
jgi:uroporphyrin-3 C-methyltransferase